MRKVLHETFRRILAGSLTAAMCVTCFPAGAEDVLAAGSPQERDNPDIIYFVDCGDYVVDTVSEGDQFGTHNSVTDQVYGEDPGTGYQWGIVDTVSDPLKNGDNKCGGVFTDNTWPFESNAAGQDTSKTSSNRYTKNQFESGVQERYLDYKFEIENGAYNVTVCCVDPWSCSKSPDVYLNYGKDSQVTLKKGLNASGREAATKMIEVTDGELTVNLRGTTDNNKAINLAYILIQNYREPTDEEMKDAVNRDCQALTMNSTDVTDDLVLMTEGKNGSSITWKSSNPKVLSDDGKVVARPAAGQPDAVVTLTATVTYHTYSVTKSFELHVTAESGLSNLQEFSLADVELTDPYYVTVTEKDVAFLNKFDPDRLLYNFRLTAGYKSSEISDGRFDYNKDGKYAQGPYPGGWENSRIGGHTLGHYLAAAAQAVADGYGDVKDSERYSLSDRLEYLVEGLQDCQAKLNTGFIFGATMASQSDPERQFNLLEQGTTKDTWVPWYTMHKIVNGLVETYKFTGNETALTVAEDLGEWIYARTSRWSADTQRKVLGVEYGGMNDCLYELYKYAVDTGYADAAHFKDAAHMFDEDALFEKVLAGTPNALNGLHANCTIPKFIGALNRYRALSEEEDVDRYLDYAKSFWTLMVGKHTYITGGNSECEFFGADNILDQERSHCNCETCNTHNMLKFSKQLFQITGEKKYADYFETTFINAIMASVNEETGMTTYFQPMATGFFKVYCNPDLEKNYFWCCTGTGLENFTKLGEGFYFHTDDQLIVNEYTSSNVTWNEKNIILKQETDLPTTDQVKFTVELIDKNAPASLDMRLRVPDWTAGAPVVKVNGAVQNVSAQGGYLSLDRAWADGDVVELTLPMEIRVHTLPDNAGNVFGFKYGPIVLAAELGTDDKMDTYQIGVQCDVCKTKIVKGEERTSTNGYGNTSNQGTLASELLNVVAESSVAEYMDHINEHLVRDGNSLRFTLQGTNWDGDQPLVFTPYYRIHEQRYGIYWLFAQSSKEEIEASILNSKEAGRIANVTLEGGVGIGYGSQTEGSKKDGIYPELDETGEGSVGDMGALTRYANADGSFSYLFEVDPSKKNYLNCQYSSEDNGKTMVIAAGDTQIAADTLDYKEKAADIYTVQYEIPAELLASAQDYEKRDETTNTTRNIRVLRISFSGASGEASPKLHKSAFITTNFDTNATIKKMTSDIGAVTQTGELAYRISVPLHTPQVQLQIELANKYGLLYLNGDLVDDARKQKIALESDKTQLELTVYAEDHETKKTYQLAIVREEKKEEKPKGVESVAVSPTEKSMNVGETLQLAATVLPADAPDKTVSWKSSDQRIADVSANGLVTAKSAGTVTVTATSNADGKKFASCNITVRKPSITITGSGEVAVGKSIKLKATLKNMSGSVKWSINSTKYATLKTNGKTATLKAKKKVGKVKVTVQAGAWKATKTIAVVKPVTGIKLNAKSKTLTVGKSFKLKATIKPKNATNKKVSFETSNKKVAVVDKNGKVKAKKAGTAKITVKSKSNAKVKAVCKIKVKKKK